MCGSVRLCVVGHTSILMVLPFVSKVLRHMLSHACAQNSIIHLTCHTRMSGLGALMALPFPTLLCQTCPQGLITRWRPTMCIRTAAGASLQCCLPTTNMFARHVSHSGICPMSCGYDPTVATLSKVLPHMDVPPQSYIDMIERVCEDLECASAA